MGLMDSLLGSKSKADAIVGDLNAAKREGLKTSKNALGSLNSALSTDPSRMVTKQAYDQTKGVLTAAQDARRNAQKLMAQRGLQGSSLGLASQRSIDQQAGQQVGSIQASLPGMIRDQQVNDAQTRMQAGSGLFNTAGGTQGINYGGERSGGILGIASAVAPMAGMAGGLFMQNKATNQQADFNAAYLKKMK